MRLGVVGAGKFGTTFAHAAIEAGYDVAISGSGAADEIALTIDVLAPGARRQVPAQPGDLFAGKILIDAMNYWEPVDGIDDELASADTGTSVIVQSHFPSARVVKSLNQLGYHELEELRRAPGSPDRIAVGAAGADRLAVRTVMRLIDRLGFDPVDVGSLENGVGLEPDGSPFAVTYTADELSGLVAAAVS